MFVETAIFCVRVDLAQFSPHAWGRLHHRGESESLVSAPPDYGMTKPIPELGAEFSPAFSPSGPTYRPLRLAQTQSDGYDDDFTSAMGRKLGDLLVSTADRGRLTVHPVV
jgi:hypothetical protein